MLVTKVIFLCIVYRDTKKLCSSKMENMVLLLTRKKQLEKRLKRQTAIPSACTYANPKAVDEDVSH